MVARSQDRAMKLAALKQAHAFGSASRLQKFVASPLRSLWPTALRKFGRVARSRTNTFFGARMTVLVPELVSSTIYRYGFFEEDVAFYMLSTLEPGDSFFDVGAHFGFFSLLAANLVGADGLVVSFEPMERTREVLSENLAAGAQSGKLVFRDFGVLGSAFATSNAPRGGETGEQKFVEVAVTTVDEVVGAKGIKSLKLMKIDAENAELEVLLGAAATIASLRPLIIVEAGDPESGAHATRDVVEHLLELNYVPFEMKNWSLGKHEPQSRYGFQNLLFVPAERRDCVTSPEIQG